MVKSRRVAGRIKFNDSDHPAAMDDLTISNPYTIRRSVRIAWFVEVI